MTNRNWCLLNSKDVNWERPDTSIGEDILLTSASYKDRESVSLSEITFAEVLAKHPVN